MSIFSTSQVPVAQLAQRREAFSTVLASTWAEAVAKPDYGNLLGWGLQNYCVERSRSLWGREVAATLQRKTGALVVLGSRGATLSLRYGGCLLLSRPSG